MAKIANRLLARSNWHTIIFLLLLWQNIVVVQPEDGANDGATPRTKPTDDYLRLAGGGKGSSLKVDLYTDLLDVTKSGPKKDLNPAHGISMGLDIQSKSQDIQKTESTIRTPKKPRILCLHGHGETAEILEDHLKVWPKYVLEKMDLVFINASFPIAGGFEWFTPQENKNFDEGIAYIEDRMVELGPFEGVLGFSQGAFITGALPGMQEQGLCLTRVGKIQHVIIISGGKLGSEEYSFPKLAENAYSSPINVPSLHIFGVNDVARPSASELVKVYVDPMVIYHHGGHEVPKLDEEGLNVVFEFLKKINALV